MTSAEGHGKRLYAISQDRQIEQEHFMYGLDFYGMDYNLEGWPRERKELSRFMAFRLKFINKGERD